MRDCGGALHQENDAAAAAAKHKGCTETRGTRTYDGDIGNLVHSAPFSH